ncbi:MAG: chromosome partitioning protein ParB [Saprospirales bacterium]|nr:chromosome partitioning protein ParB [Saprospirales bacterium]|tara:strand:+ start:5389 stop:6279 length:891 start_codon:yes stop_codon:yes gene_type:complete
MANGKREAMGKGIRALLSDIAETPSTSSVGSLSGRSKSIGEVLNIPILEIKVNPFQPRVEFDDEKLEELAESIRIHGVVQPLTVRRETSGKIELIAGERRLRASKLAGLLEVPCYVRNASDQESLEIALIENIQREDLNALEVGRSYERLIEECSLTHEELSQRLGKKRATISNYLRLLKLPPDVQNAISDQRISMGHARALAGLEDVLLQLDLLHEILSDNLSVREVERRIASLSKRKPKAKNKKKSSSFKAMEEKLSSQWSTRVRLNQKANGSGEMSVYFHNEEDLQRILDLLQ